MWVQYKGRFSTDLLNKIWIPNSFLSIFFEKRIMKSEVVQIRVEKEQERMPAEESGLSILQKGSLIGEDTDGGKYLKAIMFEISKTDSFSIKTVRTGREDMRLRRCQSKDIHQ